MALTYPVRHHTTKRSYDNRGDECDYLDSYLYIVEGGAIEGWRSKSVLSSIGEYYGGIEVHSANPRYDGQKAMSRQCQWVGNGVCYSDGSSLAFDKIRDLFDTPHMLFAELEEWAKRHLT